MKVWIFEDHRNESTCSLKGIGKVYITRCIKNVNFIIANNAGNSAIDTTAEKENNEIERQEVMTDQEVRKPPIKKLIFG